MTHLTSGRLLCLKTPLPPLFPPTLLTTICSSQHHKLFCYFPQTTLSCTIYQHNIHAQTIQHGQEKITEHGTAVLLLRTSTQFHNHSLRTPFLQCTTCDSLPLLLWLICFIKGNIGDTSERRGGARMGFPERTAPS